MIVDANVLLSALLGRSLPLLAAVREAGIELNVPAHQLHEVRQVLRHRFALDPERVEAELERLDASVSVIDAGLYDGAEQVARGRLPPAGPRDWPVLAAALALDQPILSNDRDFFGIGVAVWSTPVLRRELELLNG
jgi:predicted nucleic acid-binding protein